jgi:hypothetical protein
MEGQEEVSTLITRNNIAHSFYDQGKFYEAKKEFEEVLDLHGKVLGQDHAHTLKTKTLLSATLQVSTPLERRKKR